MEADDAATDESVEAWLSLARFVRDHAQEVQASWLERVKQRPGARDVPDAALRAAVAPFLRWLGEQIGPPSGASMEALTHELAGARPVELVDDNEIVAADNLHRDDRDSASDVFWLSL